jgi:DNA topoisomerase-1
MSAAAHTAPQASAPPAPASSHPSPSPDPASVASARAAGLRYVYDSRPGISRYRRGKHFAYNGADGKPVRDQETLKRIHSIVIPPAWTDVWICPTANGHLQATGRDARGRKQSRYHPRWREVRDEAKYEHMLHFGASLPALRRAVEHDLKLPGLPREKVLATIVRLLEATLIRVGNAEYAKENHSFGLTTLRRRHVAIEGAKLTFRFKGKSGVEHDIHLTDRRLARTVKACYEIPGYELFDYLDNDGNPHSISSTDVNDYLRSLTGEDFTAKDFRTWSGTVLACQLLRECGACVDAAKARSIERQRKRDVIAAIKTVSQRLGNTPSVCRKCYVHPAVLESYLSGTFTETLSKLVEGEKMDVGSLHPEEHALMHLLDEEMKHARKTHT